MSSPPPQFLPVLPPQFEGEPVLQAASLLVPSLRDPGQEKMGEVGYMVRAGHRDKLHRIQNMQVGVEDVWVVTYPRSGTTWTQEMIWSILNDLDFETAQKTDIDKKFFFLDMDWLQGSSTNISACEEALGRRRLVKSHQPLSLLPRDLLTKAKVVYVGRNPKDVAVSYYHHHRLTKNASPDLTFPDFLKLFMKELLVQDPYLGHLQEGLAREQEENLLFLWYEDMKADLPAAIRRVADFLSKSLTADQVARLADYLSIKNMKNNPAVNHADRHEKGRFLEGESFIRKGEAGGWRKEFSPEMDRQFMEWIQAKTGGQQIPFRWS